MKIVAYSHRIYQYNEDDFRRRRPQIHILGRVVVFPWLDTYKKVDVQASAFRFVCFLQWDPDKCKIGRRLLNSSCDFTSNIKYLPQNLGF